MFFHVTSVLATLKQRMARRGTAGGDGATPGEQRKDGKSESSKKQR